MTRVGWVGLGAMGFAHGPLCRPCWIHDAAYDIDPGRAASLAADGVKPAASILVVASGAAILVLMVATPGQVEEVLFGDDPGGLRAHARDGRPGDGNRRPCRRPALGGPSG
jgi:3-hydroxyisobutyrate dehydrogenase